MGCLRVGFEGRVDVVAIVLNLYLDRLEDGYSKLQFLDDT